MEKNSFKMTFKTLIVCSSYSIMINNFPNSENSMTTTRPFLEAKLFIYTLCTR